MSEQQNNLKQEFYCFTEQSFNIVEVGGLKENIWVTLQRAEILNFVEAQAAGVNMPNALCVQLKQQDGFTEVEKMIEDGKVSLAGVKLVILLFGRADLWLEERVYLTALHKCINTIHRINSDGLDHPNSDLTDTR